MGDHRQILLYNDEMIKEWPPAVKEYLGGADYLRTKTRLWHKLCNQGEDFWLMGTIWGEIETGSESPMERRRFSRLVISLAVEYHFLQPETGEVHHGQGVLRDISLSGSYFHPDKPLPLIPGLVLSLTIAAPLPYLDMDYTSHLKAQGAVVRVDPPGGADPRPGVAINFLESLTFSSS